VIDLDVILVGGRDLLFRHERSLGNIVKCDAHLGRSEHHAGIEQHGYDEEGNGDGDDAAEQELEKWWHLSVFWYYFTWK
jgi:hypothetical protein